MSGNMMAQETAKPNTVRKLTEMNTTARIARMTTGAR